MTLSLPQPHNNISHSSEQPFLERVQTITSQIEARGDLPHVSAEKQTRLLEELTQFKLGRFLIERGGLNGYWTHYIVTYSKRDLSRTVHPLEHCMLTEFPTVLATQERFEIFKQIAQNHLFEGISIASIPSGLMGDVLDLDFSSLSQFSITGIDLDEESLHLSQELAKKKNLSKQCTFIQKDAWDLEERNSFDLILSNGLTIYEQSDERVIELYRRFFSSLKPNGLLTTSFLTPPPLQTEKTEWLMNNVDPEKALLQKIIFADILSSKWQVFRPESKVRAQLEAAGFKNIQLFHDKAHIFPTIVAKKI